ncbi:MAG TPA: hypothetical protein VFV72_12535 [Candidatus Limnocylindrales bacterium]|nr:hypothetical protein [Candidatus Limnocylindrales bacterium]
MDVVVALTLVGAAWLLLAVLLSRDRSSSLRERAASSRGRALLGVGIGLTVGIGVLVARTDLLPDSMEPPLVPIAVIGTSACAALVGWLAWTAGRS